jgi:hypothetical protein
MGIVRCKAKVDASILYRFCDEPPVVFIKLLSMAGVENNVDMA